MVKSSTGKMNMRSFEVMEAFKHGGCKTKSHAGRYVARTPFQAAAKAFTRLCKYKRIRGQCTLVVAVRETTSGSVHKVYRYKLKRSKLPEPLVMMEGTNKEFVIEYNVSGKSLKDNSPCKKPGQSRGRMKSKTRGRVGKKLTGNNVRRLRSRRAKQ
tara:strand:- start:415 stop:882 length:468 start_codon:yes stop_codon:yes gene_type:complete